MVIYMDLSQVYSLFYQFTQILISKFLSQLVRLIRPRGPELVLLWGCKKSIIATVTVTVTFEVNVRYYYVCGYMLLRSMVIFLQQY